MTARASATTVERGVASALAPFEGIPWIVACSGGVDSMTLLYAAARARARARRAELTVAHLHHGLRGTEADLDARLVAASCARLGLPCIVERVDVAALAAAHRMSLEAAGRLARRRFFARLVADVVGAPVEKAAADQGEGQGEGQAATSGRCDAGDDRPPAVVLLAHHQDDQVETVLMRLLAAAGLEGLGGMRAVQDLRPPPQEVEDGEKRQRVGVIDGGDRARAGSGYRVVRPFLGIPKATLVAYAWAQAIPWREDGSNFDPRHGRNALRLALPDLDVALPTLRRDLLEGAAAARAAWRRLDAACAARVATASAPLTALEGGGLLLRIPAADLADPTSRDGWRSVAMHLLRRHYGLPPRRRGDWQALADLLAASTAGGSIRIAGRVDILRDLDGLVFTPDSPHLPHPPHLPQAAPLVCLSGASRPPMSSTAPAVSGQPERAGGASVTGDKRRVLADLAERLRSLPAMGESWGIEARAAGAEGWRLSASMEPGRAAPPGADRGDPTVAWLDADRLRGPLWLRERAEGDRLTPLGAPGSKKVKDLLGDRKVPWRLRRRVLLLGDEEGILWVWPIVPAARAALTPQTQRALRLALRPLGMDPVSIAGQSAR